MTRPNAIKDRERITDIIVDVTKDICPSWSIDTLNAHPFDAIGVYATVCQRAGKISSAKLRAVSKWLLACPLIVGDDATLKTEINNAARIALASRKRGDLNRDRY